MRFLFFVFGLPIMMMSFFEVADVVPLANNIDLLVDGNVIELSEVQQAEFEEKVCSLFEGSRTIPAFGVALHDEFVESLKEGSFVCLTFAMPKEVNGLVFDQLMFEISDATSFNVIRGNHGIFQGRCLFVDLVDGTMQDLCEFVNDLSTSDEQGEETDQEESNGEYEQEEQNQEEQEETENSDEINEEA